MKIGVFDSGIGVQSVANAITRALPEHEVLFRNDAAHVPYGNRKPEEVRQFVTPILNELAQDGCQIIVIACNTVSTTLITSLRRQIDVPLIAMEPMIKPAAQLSESGIIAVCATPATLASERYVWLKNNYAQNITVLEPDCSDWSYLIEHDELDEAKIAERINGVLRDGADVIVLGCTHYHWIFNEITQLGKDKAVVIQPEGAVISQLKRVIGSIYPA